MASYGIDATPKWIKVATFTEASISIANTVATVTCDPLQPVAGKSFIIHDCMVNVRQVFDGAGTVLIDVGKSGDLDRYMKAQTVKTATGRFLGSADTTNVKPRIQDDVGVIPLITVTSGSGNISTFTTGQADVWLLVSQAP